jgi:hypothetical protein
LVGFDDVVSKIFTVDWHMRSVTFKLCMYVPCTALA